ncbi:hypothetical protein [Rhizobium sp. FKY42]|uniref:hypothetical protein n=1 Tax=Rhizobium sp. FKY42 TaxID=2562310 RepID=UPI0010C00BC2|nr:hypothetical protein [Rhizobium sp. FKY42]
MSGQKYLTLLAATAISSLSLLSLAHAGAKAIETPVSFALVMRGAEPVIGTAKCRPRQNCELVTGDSNIRLVFTSKGSGMGSTLSIDCTPSCSFVSGRSSIDINEATRQPIEIYQGEDRLIETLLVLRPRHVIGSLKLIMHKR